MPHLFTNRPRTSRVFDNDSNLTINFRWETVNSLLYELGGLLFIVGSALFFPRFEAYKDLGAWLFFVGSLVYLLVHDMMEIYQFWPKRRLSPSRMLEVSALWSYVAGTVLFTVGSLFFLSWWDWIMAGAWCFVIGSILFVFGACLNVLMIIRASSLMTLQLMNLTAVTFVIGSGLFVVASIPYLWDIKSPADEEKMFAFLAWLFLIGSVLFLIGGLFNHQRSRLVMQARLDALANDPQADNRLLSFVRGEIEEDEFYSHKQGRIGETRGKRGTSNR